MTARPALPCLVAAFLLTAGLPQARAQSDDSAFDTLNAADRTYRTDALRQVLDGPPQGQRQWSNILSGNGGILVAAGDKAAADGGLCRTVRETLRNGVGSAHGSTTACRNPAATTWTIVRSSMSPVAPVPADLPQEDSDATLPAGPSAQIPAQVYIDGSKYLQENSGRLRNNP